MKVDQNTFKRRLEYLRQQIVDLLQAIDAPDDVYHPMMSWDRFEEEYREAEAIYGRMCVLCPDVPHICSMSARLVEAHMTKKRMKCEAA
jgi:hypothetical protein